MKINEIDSIGAYLGKTPVSRIVLNNTQVYPPVSDYSSMYLTFKIVSKGSIGIKTIGTLTKRVIQYSINFNDWKSIASGDNKEIKYIKGLNPGDTVRFKGFNKSYATSNTNYISFSGGDAKYDVYGNIMSLVDSDLFEGDNTLTEKYAFCSLFRESNIRFATNLVLPATTLTEGCYRAMFCKSPYLIKTPTVLPATILKEGCYWYMFAGCTNIKNSPEIHAECLIPMSCNHMFFNCENLNRITCLATQVDDNSTFDWVKGVSQTGVFTKHTTMSGWSNGRDGIPQYWNVEDVIL
jgi:hypothetical protein